MGRWFARKCRRCGQFRHARDFVGGRTVGYCFYCYEHHRRALDVLSGGIPHGCVECGITVQELSERTPGDDIRMTVTMKDGFYAVLCQPCADRWEASNPQLIAGTPYGESKGVR